MFIDQDSGDDRQEYYQRSGWQTRDRNKTDMIAIMRRENKAAEKKFAWVKWISLAIIVVAAAAQYANLLWVLVWAVYVEVVNSRNQTRDELLILMHDLEITKGVVREQGDYVQTLLSERFPADND
jgi:hypothetical protein